VQGLVGSKAAPPLQPTKRTLRTATMATRAITAGERGMRDRGVEAWGMAR